MKKEEVDLFVKSHTLTFERELCALSQKTISFPRTTFARTAACNVQRKRDFDQDAVIQQKCKNLVDYIVQVQNNCFIY